MGTDRKKAIALKAADAKALLQSSLPHVLKILSGAQLAKIQKVLDADVVNPEIAREANEIYKKSVIAQSGALVNRDQKMVDRAYRLNATQIQVSERDQHVRLDLKLLLTSDALKPVTDNPDEEAYLSRIKHTLESKGVWLRFDNVLVRDPNEYGRWVVDPRSFRAWLALGYEGDQIPTKDGRIDRESLLSTVLFGAGYYEAVHRGPSQMTLTRQIEALTSEISAGIDEHNRLIMRKTQAPIVGGISDFLGGADLPDRSIWDYAHKLTIKAREQNSSGNVFRSTPFLVIAAISTRNCAKLIAQYAEDSADGAGRAVTILKVAKTAGQVAEVGLALTGVAGLVRGAVRTGGGAAASDAAVDVAAERMLAKHYGKDVEIMANCGNKTSWVPQPAGSVGGGVKPGTSSGAGTGFHKF